MSIVCVFSKSSSARSRWSLGSPRPVAATTQTFGMMVNWEVIVMMIDISHDDDDDA